jgi:Domain of unknown function (DUF4337)
MTEERRHEILFGITLAIFAAILAINDLGGGKFGDDELQLSNEKTSAYLWYQSKGIKESLAEGQRDLVKTLIAGRAIDSSHLDSLSSLQSDLDRRISRYKDEKKEILLGSKAVGQEKWVQDIEGVLGKVVGAKEIEVKLEQLGKAGDIFDLANLFLQLSLVLGAIGILMTGKRIKLVFYGLMVLSGVGGSIASFFAFTKALAL